MPTAESPNNGIVANACYGCGNKIRDRFFYQVQDKQWHLECLRCADCQGCLDTDVTCYERDGLIYCKMDYYRRFGTKRCARCHVEINQEEMVIRARHFVYHLACFACATCRKVLQTGDHYGMRDEMIYCKEHYEQMQNDFDPLFGDPYKDGMQPVPFHGNGIMGTPPELLSLQDGVARPPPTYYNGVGASQKGRPRKRKPAFTPDNCPDGIFRSHFGFENEELGLTSDGFMIHPPRQKRVRTSFKHQQLRVLKSYFALNQNPDAKDLKSLSQKTGLTKRVLQVWFQNARAKYRRNLMKGENAEPAIIDKNNQTNQDTDRTDSRSLTEDANDSASDSTEFSELRDVTISQSPACLSDVSSTSADLHGAPPSLNTTDPPNKYSSGPGFSDLFSHVNNSINTLLWSD